MTLSCRCFCLVLRVRWIVFCFCFCFGLLMESCWESMCGIPWCFEFHLWNDLSLFAHYSWNPLCSVLRRKGLVLPFSPSVTLLLPNCSNTLSELLSAVNIKTNWLKYIYDNSMVSCICILKKVKPKAEVAWPRYQNHTSNSPSIAHCGHIYDMWPV